MKQSQEFKTCRCHIVYLSETALASHGPGHQKNVPAMKTPLNPTFFILEFGYAGVYIFFYFFLKTSCWYTLEQPRKNIKIFLVKNFNFFNFGKICISHGQVFVMLSVKCPRMNDKNVA